MADELGLPRSRLARDLRDPLPYVVLPDEERMWFEHRAPYMPQYWWLLEPRPLTTSISQVDCCWWTYRWMHELLDERPMEHGVRQGRRCGFVFVEVSRYPYSRTEIEVQVIVTEVSATLDGTPLDDTGRPIR